MREPALIVTHAYEGGPHPGALWYESFGWGMTGERFRDLVRYALLELGLRLAPVPAGGVEG